MKLDESVVKSIVSGISGIMGAVAYLTLREKLKNLDLVFKLGDASQSTLVENKPEEK